MLQRHLGFDNSVILNQKISTEKVKASFEVASKLPKRNFKKRLLFRLLLGIIRVCWRISLIGSP